MAVPSSEQKQSGSTQTDLSHGGALLGSWLMSQYVSSEPSCKVESILLILW